MGILCVFCVYDTIGNRCFEKTSFPKIKQFLICYLSSTIYDLITTRHTQLYQNSISAFESSVDPDQLDSYEVS